MEEFDEAKLLCPLCGGSKSIGKGSTEAVLICDTCKLVSTKDVLIEENLDPEHLNGPDESEGIVEDFKRQSETLITTIKTSVFHSKE